ncbi:IS21 family transposase [Burkholderia cepacia]|uniref:IS21 family transposase n=1 Tax=Burkholderia cepacia TaxID=292 RepID=UPI000758A812|nr:IS21 family transposase [Burkholderia cepacia]KVK90926.1 hypothetical protein WS93_35295 [Burkholderia cepacia]
MYVREKVPLRRWLRQTDAVEPKYPKRVSPSVFDDWAAQLTGWLRADSHRPNRGALPLRARPSAPMRANVQNQPLSDLVQFTAPELTVEDVLQDERTRLMPNPRPFDGYIQQTLRVSLTSLVHFPRNRYSVPTEYTNQLVSVRCYPAYLSVVANAQKIARHERSFERHKTFYDWRHYVTLVERKQTSARVWQFTAVVLLIAGISYGRQELGCPPADNSESTRESVAHTHCVVSRLRHGRCVPRCSVDVADGLAHKFQSTECISVSH